ncbi:MAG: FHA domain-containing protein [Planctomycetes bacterium]|nr:FHA domain-containing protein [Planctomycetota bacterium]
MPAEPKLLVRLKLGGEQVVPLRGQPIAIGRGAGQDVRLTDRKISSAHALLEPTPGGYRIRDLGSTNGTYVNDQLVHGVRPLQLEDMIQFGDTQVLYTLRERGTVQWPPPTLSSDEALLREFDDLEDPGLRTLKFTLKDLEQEFVQPDEGADQLRQRLEALFRVTTVLKSASSIPQLLENTLELVFSASKADRGVILLKGVRPDSPLRPIASRERSRQSRSAGEGSSKGGTTVVRAIDLQRFSRGLLDEAVHSGEAVLSRDTRADGRFASNFSIHANGITSAVAVPLPGPEGTLGVLYLDKRGFESPPFRQEDLQLSAIVAQQAGAAVSGLNMLEALRHANAELETARDEILRWNQELERKVQERTSEVQAQATQIAELNREKDALMGMVAHDLRTPLAGLLGFAEIALEGLDSGEDPKTVREDLDVIKSTAMEMNELLSDLLDVSRIEAGKVQFSPEPVNLIEFLGESRRRYELLAARKQIGFSLALPDELPPVSLDPLRIRQVLNNLVSNACKFTNPGGTVTLRARVTAAAFEVSVSDTGQGIAADELDRVFQRYEQTSAQPTAGEKGSGLGLAIAKRLVEMHGGRIWVESQPGVGTRFTFALPR